MKRIFLLSLVIFALMLSACTHGLADYDVQILNTSASDVVVDGSEVVAPGQSAWRQSCGGGEGLVFSIEGTSPMGNAVEISTHSPAEHPKSFLFETFVVRVDNDPNSDQEINEEDGTTATFTVGSPAVEVNVFIK